MKYFKLPFLLIMAIILLSVFIIPNITSASTTKGLTVSPLREEFDIAPGTSVDGILTIKNSTDNSMTVYFSADEFSVINQQYDYAFTKESDTAKWVTFKSEKMILKAGETQKITFSVGVPLSAEPGGRYISLFVSTDVNSSSNEANSLQRIASLLYITVTGDVSRSGNLLALNAPWLTGDDAIWSATLQNTGTTHFRSRYNVRVKNLLGGDIIATKQSDGLILPGTVRLISDNIPMPQLPGIYKVIYTIGLGDTPARVETRYVIYAPISSIILLVTVAIVLTYFFVFKKKSKKNS